MAEVDVGRCLEHLEAVERSRGLGDLLNAEAALDAAIGCAPLELMPYLKLGRERFVEDAIAMEPGFQRRLRALGLKDAPPKLRNRFRWSRRDDFPAATGENQGNA